MKKTTFLLIFLCVASMAIAQQASISGYILKPDSTVAPGVTARLLDSQGQVVATTGIDAAGRYQFSGIATGQTYTVVPELAERPLDGVSTFDIVLGARHILGAALLDAPFKLLAGDVNDSQSLTTYDLIYIRRMVLGAEDSFMRNWLFLPADVQFFSDDNPWLGFSGGDGSVFLDGNVTGFDFYAIKVGDLSW